MFFWDEKLLFLFNRSEDEIEKYNTNIIIFYNKNNYEKFERMNAWNSK